jgi:uncharacterized protein YegL
MGGMNTNLTHIAFILDRSSSMESMRAEAIGGFNAFLKEQQDNEGEANLSVILFDHEYSPLVCGVPIAEMQPLTEKDYEPRGMTALLDAIGRTIDDLGKRLDAMPKAERPGDVILVVLTDGLENASNDYSRDKVSKMIQHQQTTYDWQFLFLGANFDSVQEAQDLGIQKACSSVFKSVEEGMSLSSRTISERRRQKSKNKKKIGF